MGILREARSTFRQIRGLKKARVVRIRLLYAGHETKGRVWKQGLNKHWSLIRAARFSWSSRPSVHGFNARNLFVPGW